MAGRVPNLYAIMAYSDHVLGNYLASQNGKSSLKAKEREAINLVVSQYNHCVYCLATHTEIAKNGFIDDQIPDIRRAEIPFDAKLNALAKLVKGIVANKGHVDQQLINTFYDEGNSRGASVDTVSVISDKTISNYLHAVAKVPVDFPAAPEL